MMGVYGGSRLNQKINFFQKQKNLSRKLMKILLFSLETESEKFCSASQSISFQGAATFSQTTLNTETLK